MKTCTGMAAEVTRIVTLASYQQWLKCIPQCEAWPVLHRCDREADVSARPEVRGPGVRRPGWVRGESGQGGRGGGGGGAELPQSAAAVPRPGAAPQPGPGQWPQHSDIHHYITSLQAMPPGVQKTPDRKVVGSPGVQGSPKKVNVCPSHDLF